MKKRKKIILCTAALSATLQFSCKKDDNSDSSPQPITLECTNITANKTFENIVADPSLPDYIVPCTIVITAKVTVNPGVNIQFESNSGFSVENSGSITAVGTVDLPIVFKGAINTPGSWKGIAIRSNNVSNILSYVTIDGGGSSSFSGADEVANILVDRISQLRMNNCIIKNSGREGLLENGVASNEENPLKEFSSNQFINNANYPISILPPLAASMDEATTFSGNGKQKICIRGGELTNDAIWKKTQVPYFISGDVSIGTWDYGSLTINPGCTLYFDANSSLAKGQYGNGFLKIVGTSTQRITLTGEVESPGSWQGIGFQSTNVLNEIAFTDISYGGCCSFSGSSGDVGNVVVGAFSAGFVKISNTSVNFSQQCGIKVKSPASSINNAGGITYNGNAAGTLCN